MSSKIIARLTLGVLTYDHLVTEPKAEIKLVVPACNCSPDILGDSIYGPNYMTLKFLRQETIGVIEGTVIIRYTLDWITDA